MSPYRPQVRVSNQVSRGFDSFGGPQKMRNRFRILSLRRSETTETVKRSHEKTVSLEQASEQTIETLPLCTLSFRGFGSFAFALFARARESLEKRGSTVLFRVQLRKRTPGRL